MSLNGLDTVGNFLLVSAAANNNGVFLLDNNLIGTTQLFNSGFLKVQTQLFGDNLAAGQNSDILEHSLSSVTKAGSLNSNTGEGSAELVDD